MITHYQTLLKDQSLKVRRLGGKDVTVTTFRVPKSDYKSTKDLYKQNRSFFDKDDNELARNTLVRGNEKNAMINDPRSKTYSGPNILSVKQQSKEVNRHLNRTYMGF